MSGWVDPTMASAFATLVDGMAPHLPHAPGRRAWRDASTAWVERAVLRVSRWRAALAAWLAYWRVPAYRAFVREHGVRPAMRFADFPVTSKASYVHRYALAAICRGGKLPRGGVIDESSGSSGTANNWARGPAERAATARAIRRAARATFGDRDFIVLNAFALGPWATGMAVSMALADAYLVKSIGPDIQKVIATLKTLGPGRPYLIAGYPPFLRLVCEREDIAWDEYEIHAVCGGEGLSEPMRDVLSRRFVKTISSFGASDLEINIGAETEYSIALRRTLIAKPALARALLGAVDGVPMVFQYNPLDYFLEADRERNLLVTVNRVSVVSPRIRYNLRDRVALRTSEDVARVLAEHGVVLAERRHPLPFLFHWGRQDSTVAFYGCKVSPEDLQHAVLETPALAPYVAELALHPWQDESGEARLDLWIELREGATLEVTRELTAQLLHHLAEVNQDFRESIRMVPPGRWPNVTLFAAGTSPLSGQDARLKKRYVV
ncbi:MAG TPA: hypothetical protein VGM90_08455 [Kofleriaceae bacterium]|jgi:phenylacetate-CoA ligase